MKRLSALLVLCLLALRFSAQAQNADDQYVRVYSLIQEGDTLSDANKNKEALGKYLEAQTNLIRFQRSFPTWNALVVDFRMSYLTGQIGTVRSKLPVVIEPKAVVATGPAPSPESLAQQEAQLNALRTQMGMLEAQKSDLELKLKEAFAAQPAAVDPRELAKAQQDLRNLQKENDLLKTSLTQAQSAANKPADTKQIAQLKQQLDESNRKLADASDKSSKQAAANAAEVAAATEKLAAAQAVNDRLKTTMAEAQAAAEKSAASSAADSKAVTQLKQQLSESNQKLQDAAAEAAKQANANTTGAATANEKLVMLQKENDILKSNLSSAEAKASSSAADSKALEELKTQLADSNRKLATATEQATKVASANSTEANTANEKVSALQKENDALKAGLAEAQVNATRSAADTKAVAQLKQQLADSNRKLSDASDKVTKVSSANERETAAANEKLAAMQKENDRLKNSLGAVEARTTSSAADKKTIAQLKQQLADSNEKLQAASEKAAKLSKANQNDLAAANEKLAALQKENDSLKTNLKTAQSKPADTKEVALLKQQLADSNAKLADASARASKLAAKTPSALPADADKVLRAENDVLKKQLDSLQTPGTNAPGDVSQELTMTRAKIAALESDTEILKLENLALANRASSATLTAPPSTAAIVAPAPDVTQSKLDQVAKERDDLKKKLNSAQKQLAKNNIPVNTEMETPGTNIVEAQNIKARLDVLEATAVPYTPEELALFRAPDASLSAVSNAAPVDTEKLLTHAQRAFAAGQFDQAQQDYLDLLKQDPHNYKVLADLANIEISQNKFDDADKHVQRAVALAPSDAYNLSVLGNLRFHQERYDDALNALSRAAVLSPQNPEIQNYLGVTLSHKGFRAQAETALRKALQLEPKYGSAHQNLAVIYLAQNPPFTELARWHYQKALASGFPHNEALEKQLESKPATVTQ